MNSWYVERAAIGFRTAFGDDPNIVSVQEIGNRVLVTVFDLTDGFYPTVIDGIPVLYRAVPFEEAS